MKTSLRDNPTEVLVIGAGPAGLTAADEILRLGGMPTVLEASHEVGGIARTVRWKEHRIDIGGHRFFTKSAWVSERWKEWLGADFLKVRRLSRIYYRRKFYHYPLRPWNVFRNLGPLECLLAIGSAIRARIRPIHPEASFSDWVTNRFGARLFDTFFKTYTEKVWGIPCSKIRADWAAQRIQGLSLWSSLRHAFGRKSQVKSLIETFDYPRLGPGMLWERVANHITAEGGSLYLGTRVLHLDCDGNRIVSASVEESGREYRINVDQVISTMPVGHLVGTLRPAAPEAVRDAARALKHRDFLIVALIVRQQDLFPDNWIYVHDPKYRVGRIQNFGNWSNALVGEQGCSLIGMEYFCSSGDDLWEQSETELIGLARVELSRMGLAHMGDIAEGHVIRQRNAYPVYDETYAANLATIREYLSQFENLATAGRSGLHRYNNQDHSMLSARAAVHQLMGKPGASDSDPWDVNIERSYHEEQVVTAPAHS